MLSPTTTETNRQIRLKKRPVGMPTPADFEFVASPRPAPRDGEVLRRTLYLSLDPYMRGRMSNAESYASPVNLGDVMVGHTVSQIVDSHHPDFHPGAHRSVRRQELRQDARARFTRVAQAFRLR
ncbi:MAG TPA: hypothetical protein VGQ16_02680 [Vicinamibacterales bacterium]|jgi:hypothetical protein|nr:hypothetical protein [Vicinamibacterales bacterium]